MCVCVCVCVCLCLGALLILKKCIVLPHTLSAYNSLLVRYNVYSPDPRKCLCPTL